MSNTKKGFMKAGAIIGIIEASILLLTAFILIFSTGIITYDFVVELLTAEGEIDAFTESEIKMVVSIARVVYVGMSLFIAGLGLAELLLSIKVLKQANAGINKKGCIIALLVLSLLTANLVTFAFMIVALCLKNGTTAPVPAGSNQE